MIFDTHAHYDDKQFDEDRQELLLGLAEQNVKKVVNICASWDSVQKTVEFAKKYPFMYGAVGLHPDCVHELNEERFEQLRAICHAERIVAIGEIGLDYHWMVSSKEVQKEWFIRQLELAKEEDLPVVIHSRDASQDSFDIMKAHHAGTTGGVIHCYSGSVEMAREYVKLGYYLGIGGVVTFKNSKVLKNVVKEIPLSHLVLETDCPYLSPTPFRGKRNDSTRLSYVVETIAELKGCSMEEVEEVTWNNAHDLYRIKEM